MNKSMMNHRGPPPLCGTTPSFPSLLLRQGEKKDSPLGGHPEKNHTPDLSVFSLSDQPNMFLIILPGPGGSGESSGHEGQAIWTAHREPISISQKIVGPWLRKRPFPRLCMQLQRRLLCMSCLIHSRTPDPSPSTHTQ